MAKSLNLSVVQHVECSGFVRLYREKQQKTKLGVRLSCQQDLASTNLEDRRKNVTCSDWYQFLLRHSSVDSEFGVNMKVGSNLSCISSCLFS